MLTLNSHLEEVVSTLTHKRKNLFDKAVKTGTNRYWQVDKLLEDLTVLPQELGKYLQITDETKVDEALNNGLTLAVKDAKILGEDGKLFKTTSIRFYASPVISNYSIVGQWYYYEDKYFGKTAALEAHEHYMTRNNEIRSWKTFDSLSALVGRMLDSYLHPEKIQNRFDIIEAATI